MMHRIFFAFIWIIGRVLLWIYRVDVKGLENLPKHSVLLCPNHSTDLDPVLIGLCLPLDYHLHFMAKAELFAHAHAGIAMIGVRTGATLVPVFCDGQKKPFHKTRIIFGEPYVPEVTGRRGTSEELQAIADEMLRQAYALGGQQVGGAPL